MPPRCNDKGFQNKVIDFIGERLGIDAYASFEGNRQRTQLNSVLKEAASYFNFGYGPQMWRWWYYFQKYGYVPAEKTKYKRTSKRTKKGKNKTQWTSRHTRNLREIIEDDPDLYLDELQFVFCELGHGFWSAKHLWEKLTMELGYSLQVAADKSYSADCEERQEFTQALKDRIIHPRQLILMDESQKDRNSSRRRRSWSKKGISPSRHAYFDGDGMRYTFLAVADIDGFIIDGCSTIEQAHGAEDSNTTRGTVDQERFELYIKEKVIPLMGRYDKGEPRSILVIDNASIHQRIRELIEHPDVGGKVIFTAPYRYVLYCGCCCCGRRLLFYIR